MSDSLPAQLRAKAHYKDGPQGEDEGKANGSASMTEEDPNGNSEVSRVGGQFRYVRIRGATKLSYISHKNTISGHCL